MILQEKIVLYFLILTAFLLPFNFAPLYLALVPVGLLVFFNKKYVKNVASTLNTQAKRFMFVGMLAYFGLNLVSLAMGGDMEEVMDDFRIKAPFLLIPLLFAGTSANVRANSQKIALAYVVGVFTISLVCIALSLGNSISFQHTELIFTKSIKPEFENESFWFLIKNSYTYFSYSSLSHFGHPTYFSMHIALAVTFIFYFLKTHLFSSYPKIKFFLKLMVPFFIVFTFLLASRAGFLTLSFVLLSVILITIFKFRKYWQGALYLVVFLIGIYFSFSNSRMGHTAQGISEYKQNPKKQVGMASSGVRLNMWKSAATVIQENFWFGAGTGNSFRKLNEQYAKDNIVLEEGLNAHNEYIETLLKNGLLGFALLALMFIYPFLIALKNMRYRLFFFLSIFSINMLFESVLSRSQGVFLFCFFYSLIVFWYQSGDEPIFKLNTEADLQRIA